jgi:hypothetical protein
MGKIKNWKLVIDRKASKPNSLGIVRSWVHTTPDHDARVDIFKRTKHSNRNAKYFVEPSNDSSFVKANSLKEAKKKAVKWMRNHSRGV